jgi:hypothetical protein
MNHIRCCEYDSGSGFDRETGMMGGNGDRALTRPCSALIRSAKPAIVGSSNKDLMGSSTRKSSRTRDTT